MIRKAQYSDLDQIGQMAQAFSESAQLPFNPVDFVEYFYTIIGAENQDILVDEELMGFLIATINPWPPARSYKIAQEIAWWVQPEFRGSGIGKELILAFIDWAQSRGAWAISMSAIESLRGDSVNFIYESLGFKKRETAYVKVL